jgi:hypothetical protein
MWVCKVAAKVARGYTKEVRGRAFNFAVNEYIVPLYRAFDAGRTKGLGALASRNPSFGLVSLGLPV